MKKSIIFFLLLILLVSCQNNADKQNSGKDFYSKTGLERPNYHLQPRQIVLAPAEKFVQDYLNNDTNTFLAFYPRLVDSVGQYISRLKEYDTVAYIPNALIIPLGKCQNVKKGDFVLTWWQRGTGLQRSYVISVLDTALVIKYLDLEWISPEDLSQSVDTINKNKCRLISTPLDPGTSIQVNNGTQSEYYMVINTIGPHIIALSWAGEMKIFHKKQVQPNRVKKDLFPGAKVIVPMYGYYIPGKIIEVKDGFAAVEVIFLDKKDTLNVPIIDIGI